MTGDTDVKLQPTAEELAKFDEWLEDRPLVIQQMARDYPPWHCYRTPLNSEHGHYTIYSYSENGTVTLVHGADSFLPSVHVFGADPTTLVVCDCGQWRHADEAQATKVHHYLEAQRLERN